MQEFWEFWSQKYQASCLESHNLQCSHLQKPLPIFGCHAHPGNVCRSPSRVVCHHSSPASRQLCGSCFKNLDRFLRQMCTIVLDCIFLYSILNSTTYISKVYITWIRFFSKHSPKAFFVGDLHFRSGPLSVQWSVNLQGHWSWKDQTRDVAATSRGGCICNKVYHQDVWDMVIS